MIKNAGSAVQIQIIYSLAVRFAPSLRRGRGASILCAGSDCLQSHSCVGIAPQYIHKPFRFNQLCAYSFSFSQELLSSSCP